MAESKIEWTDYTFNPWRGCTKVSAGCTNCYAERREAQLQRQNTALIAERDAAVAEAARLRLALELARGFADHLQGCRMLLGYADCNCGFSKMDRQAVAALAPQANPPHHIADANKMVQP